MKNAPGLQIIILAAGSSSRMGKSKQLLGINGIPLLQHAVKVALASGCGEVTVVLGDNAKQHHNAIVSLPVDVVTNYDWQKGMGSSFKKGLSHVIEKNPACAAVTVMVCDQPLLSPQHLEKLSAAYQPPVHTIVASFYQNAPGVPALFGREHFEELLNLDDGQGAKKIILQHTNQTRCIDFPEGGVDLDTIDDYNRFISD